MHDYLFDDEDGGLKAEVFEGNALDYLQGVYQGRLRFEPHRFRAANAALAFESPKLTAMAVIHPDGDIAERLEKAIQRSNGGGSLRQVKTIEHAASELRPEATSATERARFIPRQRV